MMSTVRTTDKAAPTKGKDSTSRPVQVAPGLTASSQSSTTFDDVEGYDIELMVGFEASDGEHTSRPTCDLLQIRRRPGGPPVTLAGIRAVPVGELTKSAAAGALMGVEGVGDGTRMSWLVMPKDIGSRGPTEDALRWVATIYRVALVLGDSPTKAVREAFDLAQSTAGRWVALARKRGFLGSAEGPGKVGG